MTAAEKLRIAADSLRDVVPPPRRFRVHGYCFVPTEAEITVEATSAQEALRLAHIEWRARKQNLIISNSGDEGAAFDWEPTAEEQP